LFFSGKLLRASREAAEQKEEHNDTKFAD